MNNPIELLAPARDLECGLAAINHGADAVYIGGPRFGARQAAGNSIHDIARLSEYAHQFFARVYVALNTLLEERELEEAVAIIHELWNCGVDAVIIQDFGLLQCDLPPMPLHASTQMDNRDPAWVSFLEKLGFTQVVLARELTLTEIAAIRAATDLALEFFVHGALCVSYSGRCFFSERAAGRSANRGECAQFCRHAYRLQDANGRMLGDGRHYLSLLDLDLSGHVHELTRAGISSLKIEGRLKDAAYVKNITAHYRLTIDKLLENDATLRRASSGHCRFDFEPDPRKTFHRGATDYFVHNRNNRPASLDTVKSTGEELGTVAAVDGKIIHITTEKTIANGDGLCVFNRQKKLIGFRVNRVEGKTLHLAAAVSGIEPGCPIYRNHDSAFARLLAASLTPRKLKVNTVIHCDDAHLFCRLTDEDGLVSEVTLVAPATAAPRPARLADKPGLAERLRRQMAKTGGTLFDLREIDTRIEADRPVPVATINELRRQALAAHLRLRLLRRARPEAWRDMAAKIWPDNAPLPEARVVANDTARQFLGRHGLRVVAATDPNLPLMTCRYCIKNQLGLCRKQGGKSTNEPPAEPLYLVDKTGRRRLEFDCDLCEMRLRGF
ncbi:MAG: U32 family peptidase [Desulfobulbaceae bacterium]|jgi:putative protease|nr:U32 family peptidase [Desulfobulbaceae bacterium]